MNSIAALLNFQLLKILNHIFSKFSCLASQYTIFTCFEKYYCLKLLQFQKNEEFFYLFIFYLDDYSEVKVR